MFWVLIGFTKDLCGIIFVSLFYLFPKFYLFSVLNGQGKEESEEPERPGAIISNHVSYLDILYHMHSSFPSFVAKVSCSFHMLHGTWIT